MPVVHLSVQYQYLSKNISKYREISHTIIFVNVNVLESSGFGFEKRHNRYFDENNNPLLKENFI